MKYKEKLKDPRWQKKRLEIMQRDGFTCTKCKSDKNTLNVHHWAYFNNPWDSPDCFLDTVCNNCHDEIHSFEKARQKAFYMPSFGEMKKWEPKSDEEYILHEWVSYDEANKKKGI